MKPFDTREIRFLLYDMLHTDEVLRRERYAHLDRASLDGAIESAEVVAERHFVPHNRAGDVNEPRLVDGKVVLIPEVAAACRAYIDAGFLRAHHDLDDGGMQLPWSATLAIGSIFQAANIATQAYLTLTSAAANLVKKFASPDQKRRFLGPMLDGRFFGTMALSEPQAGSSLADIRTTATLADDGSYRIAGTKQWISAGEHELAENIVHLVLAKIQGAPAGVRGISLFIVPRYRVDDEGRAGADNDVRLVSLLHKMGYRGTTSTILAFGEAGQCQGFLVGEPHRGLACMFHMMNEARIGVGLSAATLGYAGFRYSLDYAKTRLQGRQPDAKDPSAPMLRIVDHADVRHLLLTQKTYAEGALALCLYGARLCDDRDTAPSERERGDAACLLDLLTPVIKAWPSQFCLDANYCAMQILGGYGYTRDYPVEQYYRDNRLNPIHEGTNGIQAIDLLGRKVALDDGRAMRLLDTRMRASIRSAAGTPQLASLASELDAARSRLLAITTGLLSAGKTDGVRAMLANASGYLIAFGHTAVAWMWLDQALAALRGLARNDAGKLYYQGKLDACRHFFRWELPRAGTLADALARLDNAVLHIDPEGLAP